MDHFTTCDNQEYKSKSIKKKVARNYDFCIFLEVGKVGLDILGYSSALNYGNFHNSLSWGSIINNHS